MNNFESFDPLKAKNNADTDVAAIAQKREIKNILSSYVGWYDPFSELIQNSLDSLELRQNKKVENYNPKIRIIVNIQDNSLIVTDNGIGLNEEQFKQFLCPDISFKSGNTRGHKGVGATYLAYGFNMIQVSTKSGDFSAIGKMVGARTWLSDENPAGNPKIKPDSSRIEDSKFSQVDNGVSIYLKFDKDSHPKNLKWIVTDTAENWFKILSIKTGLGAIIENDVISISIHVIDKSGKETSFKTKGTSYFYPHLTISKTLTIKEINDKEAALFKLKGSNFNLPAKYKNLDAIYQKWTSDELLKLEIDGQIKLSQDDHETIKNHTPCVYAIYVYSVKVWDAINKSLNVRSGVSILYGGIQIAANNMPQGETIQIPLNRNIGRQNQIHTLVHFDNCSPDMGRKGFQSDIVSFAKEISKKIADGPLQKVKRSLRVNTGAIPNLKREAKVDDWKSEMATHELDNPLLIKSEHFFLPSNKISISSVPTREQDTIALFNQLLAGGVIRGLRVMSTNERSTYDGLIRITIEPPKSQHLYDSIKNPLGVEKSIIEEYDLPFISPPRILEYKFSLDGLIEDIENGIKNSNDISLIICWETGTEYMQNYHISSLLDPDNLSLREYHGVTHIMTNINTGQKEMDLIVLSELITYLNDPDKTIEDQILKYEE